MYFSLNYDLIKFEFCNCIHHMCIKTAILLLTMACIQGKKLCVYWLYKTLILTFLGHCLTLSLSKVFQSKLCMIIISPVLCPLYLNTYTYKVIVILVIGMSETESEKGNWCNCIVSVVRSQETNVFPFLNLSQLSTCTVSKYQ